MLVPRTMFNLHEVCDTESSRYALAGVYFERAADGSPAACATDSRRMVAATWREDAAELYPSLPGCDPSPNAGMFAAVIPKDACRKALKLAEAAKKCSKPILARNVVIDEHTLDPAKGDKQSIPIGATDLENAEVTVVRPIEGRFPKYREVYPRPASYQPTVSVKVDLKFLEDVCRTMRKVLGNPDTDYRDAVLSITDHDALLYLTARTPTIDVAGVVALIGTDDDEPPVPGWMPGPAQPVEEEAKPVDEEEAKPVDEERAEEPAPVAPATSLKDGRGCTKAEKKRLIKRLDDCNSLCHSVNADQVGEPLEEIRQEILRVHRVYSSIPHTDTASMHNLKMAVERFEQRLERWAKGQTKTAPKNTGLGRPAETRRTGNGVIKVVGQHPDGTFEVYPKSRVVVARSEPAAVLVFELGKCAFCDAGVTRGRITTIGPKLVAVTDAQGKAHWLKIAEFVDYNRNNG